MATPQPIATNAPPPPLLDMAWINSLPQPFFGRLYGRDHDWPICNFECDTGWVTIDVCGLFEVKEIGDFCSITDGHGVTRSTEAFYSDAIPEEREALTQSAPAT